MAAFRAELEAARPPRDQCSRRVPATTPPSWRGAGVPTAHALRPQPERRDQPFAAGRVGARGRRTGRRRARRRDRQARRKGPTKAPPGGETRVARHGLSAQERGEHEETQVRPRPAVCASPPPLILALGVRTARRGRSKAGGAFKAAWIYVGPHNDGGWSQAHDEGRLFVQKALGSKVQTTFKENVPEDRRSRRSSRASSATATRSSSRRRSASRRHGGRGEEAPRRQVRAGDRARRAAKNLAEYFGAGEDAIYLSGMAAGAATKNGVSATSCRSRSPRSSGTPTRSRSARRRRTRARRCKLVWTNSWFDPTKEKKAAESLIAAGADVLGQNVDCPATGQYAEAQGDPVGRLRLGREEVRAEVVADGRGLRLGPVLPERVKAAMDGTWKTGFYYGSLKDGFVELAPFGPKVSAKTKAAIAAKMSAIEAARSTSSPARSTTRAASCACRRARG